MFREIIDYLQDGDEGSYVGHMHRAVEVTNMCGGRYLCYDHGVVSGQLNDAEMAYNFLMN